MSLLDVKRAQPPMLTAEGEREISRVLAKLLADRHPGTAWTVTWVPASDERRAA